MTNVFSHQAYDLQKVSLTDAQGNSEVIESTDEHPYYVDGLGWTGAGELHIGDRVVSSDGQVLVVSANVDDKPDGGVTVYSFTVEGDHTYFVSADGEDWAWVHNTCAGQHHLFPKAFGSSTPYKNALLPYLNEAEHTLVHTRFSDFLRKETGYAFKSLDSAQWMRKFGQGKLVDITKKFYRGFSQTTEGKAIAKSIAAAKGSETVESLFDILKAQLTAEGL